MISDRSKKRRIKEKEEMMGGWRDRITEERERGRQRRKNP